MSNASQEQRTDLIRNAISFLMMIIGVAFCLQGKAPLLLPACFLVALLAVERETTAARYFAVLSLGILAAVIAGIIYGVLTHRSISLQLLVTMGLILIVISRIRGPGLSER